MTDRKYVRPDEKVALNLTAAERKILLNDVEFLDDDYEQALRATPADHAIAPDIDMEVYCPELRIEHGFQVLAECAINPRVMAAQFLNALSSPDKALYWQLRYRTDDGSEWKIDMWSAPEDYNLPRGEDFVQPMKESLTDETRQAILALKEARAEGRSPTFLSVDLYRAVLDGSVRNVSQMQHWLQSNQVGVLTAWKPGKSR